jgi:hypothetical protein
MPFAQPSRDDRQAVLAEVERLLDEYLEASREFERVLQLALEGNQPPERRSGCIQCAQVVS